MSFQIQKLLAAAVLLVGMGTVCLAQNNQDGNFNGNFQNPKRHHAPEIDPASGAAALALLAGGILVIRGRRR